MGLSRLLIPWFAACALPACYEGLPDDGGVSFLVEVDEELAPVAPDPKFRSGHELTAEDGIPRVPTQTALGMVDMPLVVDEGEIHLGSITIASEDGLTPRGVAMREVWFPDGHIGWEVNDNLSTGLGNRIRNAMEFLEEHTPLDIEEGDVTGRHLAFARAQPPGLWVSCYAKTEGYRSPNKVEPTIRMTERDGCGTIREETIVHEVGHALGFPHEFQRPDRDDFVDMSDCGSDPWNYAKLGWGPIDLEYALLSPFDHESAMHYDCVNGATAPEYNGFEQALSRHDVNNIYRVYAKPLADADDGHRFGASSAAGDFDDDGIEDLAVLGLEADPYGFYWVYANFFKGVQLDSTEGRAGTAYEPWFRQKGALTFSSNYSLNAVTGDFDGDGIDDVAVGQPGYLDGEGAVWVLKVSDRDRFDNPINAGTQAPWGGKGVMESSYVRARDVGLDAGRAHNFGASIVAGHFTSGSADDLVVGAPEASDVQGSGQFVQVVTDGGAVVQFRPGQEWNAEVTWNPDYSPLDPSSLGNEFGASVSRIDGFCDGDYASFVVGAPGHENDKGAIYAFGCSRNSWGALQAPDLVASHGSSGTGARLGTAVVGFRTADEDGDVEYVIAAGAPGYTVNGVKKGLVSLHRFDPVTGARTMMGSYAPGNGSDGDKFGHSLAVFTAGDRGEDSRNFVHLAIGMPRARVNGVRAGKVYMWKPWANFDSSASAVVWSPTDAVSSMRFGDNVATVLRDSDNGGFVVGAPKARVNGANAAGLVRVHKDKLGSGTGWSSAKQVLNVETEASKAPAN